MSWSGREEDSEIQLGAWNLNEGEIGGKRQLIPTSASLYIASGLKVNFYVNKIMFRKIQTQGASCRRRYPNNFNYLDDHSQQGSLEEI